MCPNCDLCLATIYYNNDNRSTSLMEMKYTFLDSYKLCLDSINGSELVLFQFMSSKVLTAKARLYCQHPFWHTIKGVCTYFIHNVIEYPLILSVVHIPYRLQFAFPKCTFHNSMLCCCHIQLILYI